MKSNLIHWNQYESFESITMNSLRPVFQIALSQSSFLPIHRPPQQQGTITHPKPQHPHTINMNVPASMIEYLVYDRQSQSNLNVSIGETRWCSAADPPWENAKPYPQHDKAQYKAFCSCHDNSQLFRA